MSRGFMPDFIDLNSEMNPSHTLDARTHVHNEISELNAFALVVRQ